MAFPHGTRMFSGEAINASTATGPPRVEVPLTGGTIALGSDDTVLYVNPAGTIAALTIRLPPTANQQLGKVVNINFSQTVTALTVQDSAAGTVASTSGAATAGQQYRYVSATLGWVRWQ